MKENFTQENIKSDDTHENTAKKWRHHFIKRAN